jgi:hypothetical protein
MFDEIEAEVNLAFDQLLIHLSTEIFKYFKTLAGSMLLDRVSTNWQFLANFCPFHWTFPGIFDGFCPNFAGVLRGLRAAQIGPLPGKKKTGKKAEILSKKKKKNGRRTTNTTLPTQPAELLFIEIYYFARCPCRATPRLWRNKLSASSAA